MLFEQILKLWLLIEVRIINVSLAKKKALNSVGTYCTHKDIKKLLKSAWIFEYALHDAVTYRKLLGNTHKISPTARLIEWKDSTRAQIYDMFEYALGTFNSPGKVSIH